MTRDIARRATPATPARVIVPDVVRSAATLMLPSTYGSRGDDPGLRTSGHAPSALAVQQAIGLIPAIERSLAPIEPDDLVAWITPVAAGFRSKPDDMPGYIRALYMAVEDVPAACFSDDTRRQLAQRHAFFPTPADVFALVSPIADQMMADYHLVVRVAQARPA